MSYAFNGSTSAMYTADLGIISGYPFSISVWFRPHVDANNIGILTLSDSSANGFHQIQMRDASTGANIRYRADNGSATAATKSSTSYTLSVWNHVLVVAHSATDRRIYLNGDSGATGTASRAWAGSDEVNIARHMEAGTPSAYFDGNIGPIAIWTTALPASAAISLALGQEATKVDLDGLGFYTEMVTSHRDRVGGVTISLQGTPALSSAHSPPMVFEIPQMAQPKPVFSATTASTTLAATSAATAAVKFVASTASTTQASTSAATASVPFSGAIASTAQAATSASAASVIQTITGSMGSTMAACLSSSLVSVTGVTPPPRTELVRPLSVAGTSRPRSSVGGGIGPFGVTS